MSKQVTIDISEHVFITGGTGTGKTYTGKKYLATSPFSVVVLDTKGTFTWPEIPGTKWDLGTSQQKRYSLLDGGKDLSLVRSLADLPKTKTPKIIYRPVWKELNQEYYEAFFQWCYKRGNTIVFVDEAMHVCPNPFKMPEHYFGILTRGRELNVSVWSCTQRPAKIPTEIMSEATHWFVFRLNKKKDRERLVQDSDYDTFLEKPEKYQFWYYRPDTGDEPVLSELVIRQ